MGLGHRAMRREVEKRPPFHNGVWGWPRHRLRGVGGSHPGSGGEWGGGGSEGGGGVEGERGARGGGGVVWGRGAALRAEPALFPV